ncbi:head GIN domain-containing protein [Lutibacter sp.]|uniref:head GIN domain-containing protein n=1 Tax=Lutibacter sp. TaxID=1925666 RepID=UPI0027369C60|nr:head GIN domain-containing protein [Lutibacter sp.]MDP3312506.1 head GIN domain-containing protein [Lutibacter sp.]
MKILTSLFVLFIVSTSLNAQIYSKKIKGNGIIITKTRTITDFNKISVAGSFDVKLFKGTDRVITINTDENLMDYIITEVNDGSLKIKTKEGYVINSNKKITITIPIDIIEKVSLAGSGNIFTTDVISVTDLKLNLAGSGNMNLNVSAKKIATTIAGSGNINLNGNSDHFSCNIAGSGNLNAPDFIASIATIEIAGNGDVKIMVTNEIHASIAGSGNIIYAGNPKIVKTKSIGSGSIRKKN